MAGSNQAAPSRAGTWGLAERLRQTCPSRWVEPLWSPQATDGGEALAEEISDRERCARPWALLIDDGELEDVSRILEELGTTTLRLRGGAHESGWRQPKRLLVVSDRRALALGHPVAQEQEHFVTMVVLAEPSKTLRQRLAAMGFDYLVRRPIDSTALLLLLRGALYRGREQRCERRLPIGWAVSFRAGWRLRRGTLAELSRRGCSLHVAGAAQLGVRVAVSLPADLAGGEPLALRGRVFRCERQLGRPPSAVHSVVFERDLRARARLRAILAELRSGPPPLPR